MYDHKTMNFLEYYKPSDFSICRKKYSISPTHFARVRRSGKSFNGVVFSNEKPS